MRDHSQVNSGRLQRSAPRTRHNFVPQTGHVPGPPPLVWLFTCMFCSLPSCPTLSSACSVPSCPLHSLRRRDRPEIFHIGTRDKQALFTELQAPEVQRKQASANTSSTLLPQRSIPTSTSTSQPSPSTSTRYGDSFIEEE